MRSGIPIIIKNTMTNSPGTVVSSQPGRKQHQKSGQLITSIAHMTGRTQFTIETEGMKDQNDILVCLAGNGISIDIINIFPNQIYHRRSCHKKDIGDIGETEKALPCHRELQQDFRRWRSYAGNSRCHVQNHPGIDCKTDRSASDFRLPFDHFLPGKGRGYGSCCSCPS